MLPGWCRRTKDSRLLTRTTSMRSLETSAVVRCPSRVVHQLGPARRIAVHARARGTAEERAVGLDAVPDHLDAAVLADRRHRVDRALEAVEHMHRSGGVHLEAEPVVVAADLPAGHGPPLRSAQ